MVVLFQYEIRRLVQQTHAQISHIPTTSAEKCPPGNVFLKEIKL